MPQPPVASHCPGGLASSAPLHGCRGGGEGAARSPPARCQPPAPPGAHLRPKSLRPVKRLLLCRRAGGGGSGGPRSGSALPDDPEEAAVAAMEEEEEAEGESPNSPGPAASITKLSRRRYYGARGGDWGGPGAVRPAGAPASPGSAGSAVAYRRPAGRAASSSTPCRRPGGPGGSARRQGPALALRPGAAASKSRVSASPPPCAREEAQRQKRSLSAPPPIVRCRTGKWGAGEGASSPAAATTLSGDREPPPRWTLRLPARSLAIHLHPGDLCLPGDPWLHGQQALGGQGLACSAGVVVVRLPAASKGSPCPEGVTGSPALHGQSELAFTAAVLCSQRVLNHKESQGCRGYPGTVPVSAEHSCLCSSITPSGQVQLATRTPTISRRAGGDRDTPSSSHQLQEEPNSLGKALWTLCTHGLSVESTSVVL